MSPTRHGFESLGLPIAYYQWPAVHPTDDTPVVLLHGYLDHALSFAPIAQALATSRRVIAPDHRGHGESGHIGAGGYYHFADYLLDLAHLFEHEALARAHLVGHSMGATIACYFAGAFPERVASLTLLDGLGPSAVPVERSPSLIRRWINDVRLAGQRDEAPMPTLDDVARRLARTSPHASRERLLALAETATDETPEGNFRWKFDPLHRTTSPMPFDVIRFGTFLREIRCPTFLIWGAHSPMRPADADARMALIADLTTATLPEAAHNLHHERPDELLALITPFLDRAPRA
jgi:pimeloyl-ACP methyl ester carboxylesterase